MSKDVNFYSQRDIARTLTDIKTCAKQHEMSCEHQPLVNIPLDNIVLDELNLMLKVTSRLSEHS